ncbi:YutD family protein [Levilactobacillus bambusae]|uniref:DUF1027 domain-containing protein n=1 Tax=Levilactobacillus bambusae TaxID=2024736 RepID=A0A2V1MZR3_9LACO|nr:YutD family protein [Levilactobacillus bambusae]PWF99615.1 DUF1027 domain-containing protein [Levilactobacillus bambusae]
MDRKQLEELVAEQKAVASAAAEVVRESPEALTINGHPYELVADHREAFNEEALAERFNTVLSHFDYIVGDWGFEQLRLKGFYSDDRHGSKEDAISSLEDYLIEYCNFGCAYFVLHNLDVKEPSKSRNKQRPRRRTNKKRSDNQRSEKSNAKSQPANSETNRTASKSNRRRRNKKNAKHAYTQEHVEGNQHTVDKRQNMVAVESGGQGKRHFTIRKKDNSNPNGADK